MTSYLKSASYYFAVHVFLIVRLSYDITSIMVKYLYIKLSILCYLSLLTILPIVLSNLYKQLSLWFLAYLYIQLSLFCLSISTYYYTYRTFLSLHTIILIVHTYVYIRTSTSIPTVFTYIYIQLIILCLPISA